MSSVSKRQSTAVFFLFSSRRRHTRYWRDWSSDVCSSDLHVPDVVGTVRLDRDDVEQRLARPVHRVGRRRVRRLLLVVGGQEGQQVPDLLEAGGQTGRASGRGRVEISGGAGLLKKKLFTTT